MKHTSIIGLAKVHLPLFIIDKPKILSVVVLA